MFIARLLAAESCLIGQLFFFGVILFCFGAAFFIYMESDLFIHHIAMAVFFLGQGTYLVYEHFKTKMHWERWKKSHGTRTSTSTDFIIARDGLQLDGHQWPWNAIRKAIARPKKHRVELDFAEDKARYVDALQHLGESLDWFTLVLNENIRTFGEVTEVPEALQALRNDAQPEEP